ncbi:hypothetical protein KSB_74450 [Ktedonobacter robiniae]|uniref:Uncharacterized protein n=1 Tax=Ktedonobacter robiniae TaxID=2778365 RepID=A0ABQ3V2W0_9CHLR|nr:hypothetical protein KSB_74450 [Ktedonobacter robiniae]
MITSKAKRQGFYDKSMTKEGARIHIPVIFQGYTFSIYRNYKLLPLGKLSARAIVMAAALVST